MSTAWPSITANDMVSGEGAETVAQLLFDAQDAVKGARCTGMIFVDATTASAAYATLLTARFRVPLYGVPTSNKIRFYARCKTSAGSANFRIINGATLGTDSAAITLSTYVARFSDLIIQGGWPGTIIDLTIQGKTSAGTLTVGAEQMMGNIRIMD